MMKFPPRTSTINWKVKTFLGIKKKLSKGSIKQELQYTSLLKNFFKESGDWPNLIPKMDWEKLRGRIFFLELCFANEETKYSTCCSIIYK